MEIVENEDLLPIIPFFESDDENEVTEIAEITQSDPNQKPESNDQPAEQSTNPTIPNQQPVFIQHNEPTEQIEQIDLITDSIFSFDSHEIVSSDLDSSVEFDYDSGDESDDSVELIIYEGKTYEDYEKEYVSIIEVNKPKKPRGLTDGLITIFSEYANPKELDVNDIAGVGLHELYCRMNVLLVKKYKTLPDRWVVDSRQFLTGLF